MKKRAIFIILTFIFGCSQKTTYQEIPLNLEEDVVIKQMPKSVADSYDNKMDIMIAFLWPKSLSDSSVQEKVVNILSMARGLKDDNDNLLTVNKKYENLKCTEIITGEISVEIEIEDQCYDMEDEKNDLTLKLYQKVFVIQDEVKSMGGVWFANHRDFDSLPLPTIDFISNTINFTAIGSYQTDGKPIQYLDVPFLIKQTKDFYTLYFQIDRKNENGTDTPYGHFEGKINLLPMKNSIVYQGEFNWHYNGEVREGVVYWQNIAK